MTNVISESSGFFKAINDLAEKQGLLPHVTVFETVEVHLNPENSPVFREYCLALADSLETAVALNGGNVRLDATQVTRYLTTLLDIRCKYVSGHRTLVAPRSTIYVPAFFSVILENVGMAADSSLGIELKPVFDCGDPMDEEELHKTSSILRALTKLGLHCASQMPRDRKGSWDFMAMQLVEDVVKRHDDRSHPVYAFLSSFLAFKGLETTLFARVSYGHTGKFQSMVRQFAHVSG